MTLQRTIKRREKRRRAKAAIVREQLRRAALTPEQRRKEDALRAAMNQACEWMLRDCVKTFKNNLSLSRYFNREYDRDF